MNGLKFQNYFGSSLLILGVILISIGCTEEVPPAAFGDKALEPLIGTKNLALSEITSETVTVTWQKATKEGVADENITYQVYTSTKSNIFDLDTTTTNGEAFEAPLADIAQKTITGLTKSTTYYVNVVALNSAANGAVYAMGTVTTTGGEAEVPTAAAEGLAFTDIDENSHELSGSLDITPALDEAELTHYIVYWGAGKDIKIETETAIGEIQKIGNKVSFPIANDTAVPTNATHFLVYSKNTKGEMPTGIGLAFVDKSTPGLASSLSFTDTDLDAGQLGGDVLIGMAADETDIDKYLLYWGSAADTKLGGQLPLKTLVKTGTNQTFTFPADTALQGGATHLLVYTENAGGELATPKAVALVDVAIPVNLAAGVSFTDTHGAKGTIGGTVNITKATNESDITHYVTYWGTDPNTISINIPIATVAKTGLNLSFTIPPTTGLTAATDHLLVFTKNADGEMASNISVKFLDVSIPDATSSLTFTDTDVDGGQLTGDIVIGKATNETAITDYVLYWGSSSTTKLAGKPAIWTFPANGGNHTHTLAANFPKPAGATHLLAYSKNAQMEIPTPKALAFHDTAIPTNPPLGAVFSDTDGTVREAGGNIIVTKATNESDVTQYVAYWSSNGSTKTADPAFGASSVSGFNVSITVNPNTPIPQTPVAATHILIYSRNADGEMATGTSVAIVDSQPPTNNAATVCFNDEKAPDVQRIRGNFLVRTALSSLNTITSYKIYWSDDGRTKKAGTIIIDTIATTAGAVQGVLPSINRAMDQDYRNGGLQPGFTVVVISANQWGEKSTGVGILSGIGTTGTDVVGTTPLVVNVNNATTDQVNTGNPPVTCL